MASTRRLEIFQDPSSAADTAKMPPRLSSNLTSPVFSDEIAYIGLPLSQGVVLDPPISRGSGRSPLKSVQQPNSSTPKVHHNNQADISLPPPQPTIFTTDSPLKKPVSSTLHHLTPLKPLKPIFTTFQSNASANKENTNPIYYSDNFAEFPDPSYGYKAPLKRTLSNAAPMHDKLAKKGRAEESPGPEIPEPQDMPLIEDDGRKPQYSYALLIGMSILRAPGRRLTLAQIYKWISDSFAYYRASQTGWQNSIRHNLSLNKAFIKQERPKDDPGKGNYWAIEPGMETQFIKDKASRRPTSSSGGTLLKSSSLLPSEGSILSSQSQPREVLPVTEATDLSSDATIPASDAPSQEDGVEENVKMPPPASRLPLSSPLQTVHSSPPLPLPSLLREDTPSPVADLALPSSNSRSRKRKLAAMDDSGYFSSLDSSAKRPFLDSMLSDLTADRPKIKRGRAEEEIARIRSSSHDVSPSKSRAPLKPPRSLVSSSPLRYFDSSSMLPPFTPAVRFKLPAKPPASISPNTNLRNHRNRIRELVGSPVKNTSLSNDEEVFFSPAFNIIDEEHYLLGEDFDTSFNIFRDEEHEYCRPSPSSSARRSARRPRTDRATRTGTVLADVTGTIINSKGPLSNAKVPALDSPLGQKSSKDPLVWGSRLDDVPKEDLFGLEYDEEEIDDFGGVDILQGFQKIGGNQYTVPSAKRFSRPTLGARSQTGPSRF